jgi:hypothetical protein
MRPRAAGVRLQERRTHSGIFSQLRSGFVDVLDHGDDLVGESKQRHIDVLRHLAARHDEVDACRDGAVRHVGDAAQGGVQGADRSSSMDLVQLLGRRRLVGMRVDGRHSGGRGLVQQVDVARRELNAERVAHERRHLLVAV